MKSLGTRRMPPISHVLQAFESFENKPCYRCKILSTEKKGLISLISENLRLNLEKLNLVEELILFIENLITFLALCLQLTVFQDQKRLSISNFFDKAGEENLSHMAKLEILLFSSLVSCGQHFKEDLFYPSRCLKLV